MAYQVNISLYDWEILYALLTNAITSPYLASIKCKGINGIFNCYPTLS